MASMQRRGSLGMLGVTIVVVAALVIVAMLGLENPLTDYPPPLRPMF